MECEKCPVKVACFNAKKDQLTPLMPEPKDAFAQVLERICPLEMAIQANINALGIEFGSYLLAKRRFRKFEGKK